MSEEKKKMNDNKNYFAPVFEKDGNQFLITHGEFVARTEEEALSLGTSAFECALDIRFTGEVLNIAEGITHRKAVLDTDMPVAIISGPLFDEVAEKEVEINE
jgi:hypothetical protein